MIPTGKEIKEALICPYCNEDIGLYLYSGKIGIMVFRGKAGGTRNKLSCKSCGKFVGTYDDFEERLNHRKLK